MPVHPPRRRPVPAGVSLAAVLLAGASAPAQTPAAPAAPAPTYAERWRPQYHFTPPAHWINDPNGLVYLDGEWHLFFQHNPFGNDWGHMSWGHAASADLVHWRMLPVAIPESGGIMAFSGSAVVDRANTSGFGRAGAPAIVAVYAGHRPADGRQAQYVASSTDRGRTFVSYAGNPVLDIGSKDFRDPKVFWHAPTRRWIMVVALADRRQLRLYASPDLKGWTPLSDFGPAGATGGVWECPDLFPLPLDGNRADPRWVMIVNINPGGVAGGSAAQYFVGRFDGTRFTPDASAPPAPPAVPAPADAPDATGGIPARWADYGKDFYAAVSWSDVPRRDGRRIWIGWMSDWQYAGAVPTTPWRGAMSVPRTLALRTTADGIRLVQRPVAELAALRGPVHTVGPLPIPEGRTALDARGVRGDALDLELELEPGAAREVGLAVRVGPDEETVIGVDPQGRRLWVDRARSGEVGFSRDFPGRQTAPLPMTGGRVRLRVLVDRSSVEVFGGDGEAVITDQIFPAPGSQGVTLWAHGGAARLVRLAAWPLASAWAPASARAARPLQ